MTVCIDRRALAASLIIASITPAAVAIPAERRASELILRGNDTPRLPDHAGLWSRMPLPFTPPEAWRLLSPETQEELGAALIGYVLADYVSGDMHDEADHFHDGLLRRDCVTVRDEILASLDARLWALLPDLYGPDRDHPSWALASGMAPPST